MPEATTIVAAVARHGLTDSVELIATEPLDDAVWQQVLNVCLRQRLLGHLSEAVRVGALPSTAAQRQELAAWDMHVVAHMSRLDELTAEAVAALRTARIECRVLKGPVFARTVYEPPQVRHYFDIDLLAPAPAFDAAVRTLCEAGFRRRVPALRKGYDARFAKSVTLRGPHDVEVDLHRTLCAGPFGFVLDLPSLWESTAHVEVAGERVACLSLEENLLHAACNAALGDLPARWSVLRDVAQHLRHHALDVTRFAVLVTRHRVGFAVSTGICLTADRLVLAPDHEVIEWARSYRPSSADRRRMDVYSDRRSYAYQSLETLRVLKSSRDRAAFAIASVLPSKEFLDHQSMTRVGWLRKGQRSLGQ